MIGLIFNDEKGRKTVIVSEPYERFNETDIYVAVVVEEERNKHVLREIHLDTLFGEEVIRVIKPNIEVGKRS